MLHFFYSSYSIPRQTSFAHRTLPHLLFYGPPGTGKTSTILAMSKQMFGSDFKKRVLELNASDDRGISVYVFHLSLFLQFSHLHATLEYSVREKVKMFAQGSVSSKSSTGKRIPPFKLIVLDEADSLTSAAQVRFVLKKKTHTRTCIYSLALM